MSKQGTRLAIVAFLLALAGILTGLSIYVRDLVPEKPTRAIITTREIPQAKKVPKSMALATSYTVTSVTYPEIEGVYVASGTYGGIEYFYSAATGRYIFYQGISWYIHTALGPGVGNFYSVEAYDDVMPSTAWQEYYGTFTDIEILPGEEEPAGNCIYFDSGSWYIGPDTNPDNATDSIVSTSNTPPLTGWANGAVLTPTSCEELPPPTPPETASINSVYNALDGHYPVRRIDLTIGWQNTATAELEYLLPGETVPVVIPLDPSPVPSDGTPISDTWAVILEEAITPIYVKLTVTDSDGTTLNHAEITDFRLSPVTVPNGDVPAHTHVISDVIGLQDALDAKADITAVATALLTKSDVGHTHIISNVTGLQAAIDAKASLAGANFTGAIHTTNSIDFYNGASLGGTINANPGAGNLEILATYLRLNTYGGNASFGLGAGGSGSLYCGFPANFPYANFFGGSNAVGSPPITINASNLQTAPFILLKNYSGIEQGRLRVDGSYSARNDTEFTYLRRYNGDSILRHSDDDIILGTATDIIKHAGKAQFDNEAYFPDGISVGNATSVPLTGIKTYSLVKDNSGNPIGYMPLEIAFPDYLPYISALDNLAGALDVFTDTVPNATEYHWLVGEVGVDPPGSEVEFDMTSGPSTVYSGGISGHSYTLKVYVSNGADNSQSNITGYVTYP